MTLTKAGAAAGSLMAIIGLLVLVTSFFVLASDYERNNDLQAQLDQYQTNDINAIKLATERATLLHHVTNLRTIEDMEEYKPLSDTDRGYKAMLNQSIRESITKIKKLGGSTEEIELILGED